MENFPTCNADLQYHFAKTYSFDAVNQIACDSYHVPLPIVKGILPIPKTLLIKEDSFV